MNNGDLTNQIGTILRIISAANRMNKQKDVSLEEGNRTVVIDMVPSDSNQDTFVPKKLDFPVNRAM